MKLSGRFAACQTTFNNMNKMIRPKQNTQAALWHLP